MTNLINTTTPEQAAPANPAPTATGPQYGDAYERALPAAQALPLTELIPINVDIPTAVTTAIGKFAQIASLRDAIAAATPTFDLTNIDQLETYTLATAHAHAMYLSASAPPEALLKLTADATVLRDTLYSDAVALANRGLISGARLGDFKAAIGYKNVAFDLLGLAVLLRQAWPQIEGKTALTLAELDNAELIGEQVVNAVGTREQAPVITAEVTLIRQRLFTLFAKAWDQVRRAVTYLRWNEEDFDDIVPSLYAGRVRRSPDGPLNPPGAPTAAGDGPTKTPPAATPPVASPAASASALNGAKPSTAQPSAPGTPGSSPFVP